MADDTVTIEADAATNDGFAQANTQVSVGTNNATGASLYAEMNSNMASNSLIGSAVPGNTIAETTPGTALSNNSWGYKAYNSAPPASWSAMSVYGTPTLIFDNNTFCGVASCPGMNAAGAADWTFDYGTQVDYTMPVDVYAGTILYTATTN